MRILKELELQKEVQDSIINEYNKLKQHEACIVGDVVAVLENSDRTLGKPEELCHPENDTLYVVFEPTKLAKVCGITLDVISNKEKTIKFIPVEILVSKLFEFNFMFTHMILNKDAWIAVSKKSEDIFKRFKMEMLTDENFELRFKKESTAAYCIWQDILKGKFKSKEAVFERLYCVTYLLGRVYFCDTKAMFDDFMRCYEAGEILEVVKERINKIHAENLKTIESLSLNKSKEEYKFDNYKKSYKILTGEEA